MNDEKIFEEALNEFERLGIKAEKIEKMREKDGIALLKIKTKEKSFVFKYFYNKDYRREIKIYDILKKLGIETIKVFAETEKSILMEDISESREYRLGTKEDMSDEDVAKALAKWYKNLHTKGYAYIAECGEDFYSENAVITKENMAFVKCATKTETLPVWKIIEEKFDEIKSAIENEKQTFNYNDFYYTNLVAAKDKSKAFMFDYNLFGKGAAASDINNVCWSLSQKAKTAFIKEYGPIDKKEKAAEEVASVLSSLYLACKKEVFPDWGKELIDQLEAGFEEKINRLIYN